MAHPVLSLPVHPNVIRAGGVVVRVTLVSSILALCASILPVAAHAVSQHYELNIPRESLDSALRDFATQTGLQVARFSDTINGSALVGPISGKLSADEALHTLLLDLGLSYKMVNDRTIAIVPAQALSPARPMTSQSSDQASKQDSDAEGKAGGSFWDRFRLAQVDQGKGQGTDSTVEHENDSSEKNAKNPRADLEEVTVTGSRLPTIAGEEVVPVRVYTREDIRKSGQTTLANFLNTVPDVSLTNPDLLSSGDIGTVFAGQGAGQTTVQLHGLPFGVTLVLLDGRKTGTDMGLGQFDLSVVPAAAVERVEILPVGASAIYGSNALGGAVNTILRKDFNGFEANGSFGDALGSSGRETTASLGWGQSWSRASLMLMGSYRESHTVAGSERKWTSTTDFPSDAPTFLYVTDACQPGNVYSLDGSNLPGLSSSQVAIPAGITGVPTIAQLAAGAGGLNQCNTNRYIRSTERQDESIAAVAHYDLSGSTELFAQVLFSYSKIPLPFYEARSLMTLGASNAYNPFGVDVAVSYFAYAPTAEYVPSDLMRPVIGLRGNFGSAWHYEVSALMVRNRWNRIRPNVDSSLNAWFNSPDPKVAFNPFATSPTYPSALNVFSPGREDDRITEEQALIRGPVRQLPAGPLEMVIGGEYGQTRQHSDYVPGELRRNSTAGFTEARIPLLADRAQHRDRLALTVAGRYDHSDDYGGKATWQAGLVWRARESLTFSGSYGTSYKAPTPYELRQPASVGSFQGGIFDPFRGGQEVGFVNYVFGPNPALNPETGTSRTLSLNYSSQARPGLTASLTYYAIDIANYISVHGLQELVDNPGLFPNAVVRGPRLPNDPPGFLGPITGINNGNYNFGKLRIAGFDADMSYAIETKLGKFTPSVAVSNIYRWESAITPQSPSTENVGTATYNVGWSPRWKGTAALAWTKGPVSTSVSGRYISEYLDYQLADVGYTFLPRNNHKLGNAWRFDLQTSIDLGRGFLAGNSGLPKTSLSFGVNNLFNQMPPFSYGFNDFDYFQYDLRGRFIHAEIGLKW